jgi:drug/metabolite transporter (DMT)-like permease
MSEAFGILSALLAPLAMTFGFILWGKSWKSSAYALNWFKCTTAAFVFMMISFAIRVNEPVTPNDQSVIILSSILGIVIGDNTWLLALQIIGAKKVIVIDSLKPLLAAMLGSWMLNEPVSSLAYCGIIINMIGVVLVSTEKQSEDDISAEHKNLSSGTLMWGFVLAFINVALDAVGSVLTKLSGSNLNTWEINFLRFGFASVSMTIISVVMTLYFLLKKQFLGSDGYEEIELDTYSRVSRNEDPEHNQQQRMTKKSSASTSKKDVAETVPWYAFPHKDQMTVIQWGSVLVGILFVTFVCPALSNYALFQIPLGLCLTLTSLGPIYSIPMTYLLTGEQTGYQGMIGVCLAMLGIIMIFYE